MGVGQEGEERVPRLVEAGNAPGMRGGMNTHSSHDVVMFIANAHRLQ